MRKWFFAMDPAEASVLALLVAFSAFCFLPVWRGMEIAGMAVFGWLMTALMVVSPALTLFVFHRRDKN